MIALELVTLVLSLVGIGLLCWWDSLKPEDLGSIEGWRKRK